MADQASVFDEMDDLTAQMCIGLQLEDLAEFQEATSDPSWGSWDRDVALQLHEAELKAYRAARGLPEALPLPVPRYKCVGCDDHSIAEENVRAPCNHNYCKVCIEDLCKHSMRDRAFYPPRCCRQPIPWEDVRDVVDDELKVTFEANQEELDDPMPIYCHNAHCSKYIKANVYNSSKADCSACDAVTCTLCKQDFHDGACPEDEEVQKMRAYAREEGNQECGSCHQLVELSMGCNHITCLCKHEFCYVCGVEWKNCECELFDEDRLLARADDVANRPGMGGAAAAPAIAEQLRQGHQRCDDHGHRRMFSEQGQHRCEGCNQMMPQFYYRCGDCHTVLCRRCMNNRA